MINLENQRILDKDKLLEEPISHTESKISQVKILGTLLDAYTENQTLTK